MKINNKQPIVAVAGISGAGKSSVLKKLNEFPEKFAFSISYTNRTPRAGEVDGRDYHFISDALFDLAVKAGEFLEWEDVHGHKYGTKRADIQALIDSGKIPVMEIDVKGVVNIKKKFRRVISIFVMAPSIEEAMKRLKLRQTESPEEIQKREERYRMELSYKNKFDHIIANDILEQAQDELLKTISERINRKANGLAVALEYFLMICICSLVLGLVAVKAYNYEIDSNFSAKMAEINRTYNELKAQIAAKNAAIQSAAEKVVTAPPPAEVKKNIAKAPPKYTTSGKATSTQNTNGTTTTTIATGGGVSQADLDRASAVTTTINSPADISFRDETGAHPELGKILTDYITSTLNYRNEISSMKMITLRDAGATGWAGQYLGTYTLAANGKDITSASGSIILNTYYYKDSPYFNDYMKLTLSHEYGHHYTLWHKWMDWDLPNGSRMPDSYYNVRPLSKTTTATDYSLGWQNCESEILADDYSYLYSGYGYENADIVAAYGYPSAATKTWLSKVGDPSLLTIIPNAAPTISITAPSAAATLTGAVNFTATASDDIGVNKVSFYIDSTLLGEDTTAPYSVSLNTILYSNGAHTLKAVASDGSLTAEATESVTLNNEVVVSDTTNPTVTITAPTDNPYAWSTGPLNIDISLADDTALGRVDVYVNDQKQQTWTAPSGGMKTVDLSYQIASADAGTYTIKFKVYDASGNEGETTIVVNKS